LPEYALAIVGEVLFQTQPWEASTQQARERRLARLQRLAPQVLAIQLEEVEGVEEDVLARGLAPQLLVDGKLVLIAGKPVAPPPSVARERKNLTSCEAKVCSRTAARVGSPSAVAANALTSPRRR
jgi:hypothetical protein